MPATSRHIGWLFALAIAAPGGAFAKPVGTFDFIVADPGDQTHPSIDGQYVVYSGPNAAGQLDVFLFDTLLRSKGAIAGSDAGDPPGDYDLPDVAASTAIYRGPGGIWIDYWPAVPPVRTPPAAGDGTVSAPAIGKDVAAWEVGPPGARDIRIDRWRDWDPGREYTLTAPDLGAPVGDQHAPAAWGGLVAYVDGADAQAVWLYDSAARTFTRVCDGAASSVSVGFEGVDTFVAVARATAGDQDIEVWPVPPASGPVAALRVPGEQRNPHVSGAWVAFEDVSTRFSQVVLWNWRTGLVFVPHPSETDQVLNDLSVVSGEEVRVVFEDTLSPETGRDVALYVLDLAPLADDGLPNGYPLEPPPTEPARCDGDAVPLATLRLGRITGAPFAGEAAFRAVPPAGATTLPVLVCIDADRVSSAWVTLDDEAVARPSDFNPGVVHLEVRGEADAGAGRISGVVAGKPGASLVVRVLADPARLAAPATVRASAAAAAPAVSAQGGCASARGGIASLLALALLLARGRARRG